MSIVPEKHIRSTGRLKVHFAGAEQIDFALCLAGVGVRYMLFSVFPFICDQFKISGYPVTSKKLRDVVPSVLEKACKSVIMDSGLFTLMFGAHAGKRDRKFMNRWYDALVKYVCDQKYKGVVVEIDSQKVLGPRSAWDYRRRMKRDLPNRIINVFHIEDGQKGLDRLIDFSEYIAISVPELRATGRKGYCMRLVRYIKSRKPDIDIHLLGCTEAGLLKSGRHCTSSDSTSWQQINRYGSISIGGLKLMHCQMDKDAVVDKYGSIVNGVLRRCGIEVNDKRLLYYSGYCLAGEVLKSKYASIIGSQE